MSKYLGRERPFPWVSRLSHPLIHSLIPPVTLPLFCTLVDVQPLETIDEIRQKAEMKEGASWGPYPHFLVVFGGKQLELHHTLIYYNIQKEATLHLLLPKGSGPGPVKMIYVTTPTEQTLMLNVSQSIMILTTLTMTLIMIIECY